MRKKAYLAFDLGAESGRAILGALDGGRLELTELHRFLNVPQRLPSGLHWSLLEIWGNLLTGLAKAGRHAAGSNIELASLGVDTWGVDYGLVGKSGQVLGIPYAYRDERNIPAMESVLKAVGAERLYGVTGIQFWPFNTLFQLVAQRDSEPAILEKAERLLWLPDLLNYFFSGEESNESSIASTSQMVDLRRPGEAYAVELFRELGLPTQMLGAKIPSGTKIGRLRDVLAREAGLSSSPDVIAPACHDTASAVAAVPCEAGTNWCYLSSGTWSLMGVELTAPRLGEECRLAGFTNERGVGGRIRFLKNLAGLWLVQECRRAFQKQGADHDYPTLAKMAEGAPAFRTLVDPNHGPFMLPGEMPRKIAEFASATGQPAPREIGEFVRCCLESLALGYRHTLVQLEKLIGRRIDVIHIVGGGGRNEVLDQMTADATGRSVVVGPYEATAVGNLLVQAMGRGDVKDLAEIRRIVAASFPLKTYSPAGPSWDDAYGRYVKLLG